MSDNKIEEDWTIVENKIGDMFKGLAKKNGKKNGKKGLVTNDLFKGLGKKKNTLVKTKT